MVQPRKIKRDSHVFREPNSSQLLLYHSMLYTLKEESNKKLAQKLKAVILYIRLKCYQGLITYRFGLLFSQEL